MATLKSVPCIGSQEFFSYFSKVNFGQVVRSRNQMAADGKGLGGKDVEAGNINHPF